MAKKFFYVCMGLLALAGAYHLGAESVVAQTPGDQVAAAQITTEGATRTYVSIVTLNGDVYRATLAHNAGAYNEWVYCGSLWGGVIGNSQGSIGDVKSLFR